MLHIHMFPADADSCDSPNAKRNLHSASAIGPATKGPENAEDGTAMETDSPDIEPEIDPTISCKECKKDEHDDQCVSPLSLVPWKSDRVHVVVDMDVER